MRKAVMVCTVLCLLSAFFCYSQEPPVKVPVVRAAPEFSLTASDGSTLNSASLKGSVILLEFFQTSCANCQVAAPKLEALYNKYKDKGLAVVAVSFDVPMGSIKERMQAVAPFIKQYGLTYPVVFGDRSTWMNYIQKPGFNSPLIFFIDRKGQIAAQVEEGPDHKACDINFLENQIKLLLK